MRLTLEDTLKLGVAHEDGHINLINNVLDFMLLSEVEELGWGVSFKHPKAVLQALGGFRGELPGVA